MNIFTAAGHLTSNMMTNDWILLWSHSWTADSADFFPADQLPWHGRGLPSLSAASLTFRCGMMPSRTVQMLLANMSHIFPASHELGFGHENKAHKYHCKEQHFLLSLSSSFTRSAVCFSATGTSAHWTTATDRSPFSGCMSLSPAPFSPSWLDVCLGTSVPLSEWFAGAASALADILILHMKLV